jgi:hypothetical protein
MAPQVMCIHSPGGVFMFQFAIIVVVAGVCLSILLCGVITAVRGSAVAFVGVLAIGIAAGLGFFDRPIVPPGASVVLATVEK